MANKRRKFDTESREGAVRTFRSPAAPDIRIMVVAEMYQHTVDGRPA